MRSCCSHLIVTAALLGPLCGCGVLAPAPWPLVAKVDVDRLPTGQHGVELSEDRVPSGEAVQSALDAFPIAQTARRLTAAECACRAAWSCQMAKVMEQEAAQARRDLHASRRGGGSDLLPGILREQAVEERNRAAEQALLAYYQLAEIHLQNAVLAESCLELERVRGTIQGLRHAGAPLDTDVSELDRQEAQLERRAAQLQVDEVRLTAHIKSLISDPAFSAEAIETECTLEPRAAGYELEDALQIARANDSQLRSIRKLIYSGDTDDLDVARSLLQVANPLLGQASGGVGFLAKLRCALGHRDLEDAELRVRKSQLRGLHEARQQQVDLEVANGMICVQQSLLAVGIANDVYRSWQKRVEELESRRELQKADYLELVEAKAGRLEAKSDLIHRLVQLELEHVKLRASMGLLVRECEALGTDQSGSPLPCQVLGGQG